MATMTKEANLSKRAVIAELTTRSTHGDLTAYLAAGLTTGTVDPDFFAHLTAWNALKGEIRDAKIALPVIGLATAPPEYQENAAAHLATLTPRELVKALTFSRPDPPRPGFVAPQRVLERLVERYLRELETDRRKWERRAVQHRQPLHTLYARYHVKPAPYAKAILFTGVYLPGSVFEAIKLLPHVSAPTAARLIQEHKIPFLIAESALATKAKDPDLVTELIRTMSPAELVTNTQSLERLGVREVPALRAEFEAALVKAGESKRAKSTHKTSRAAEAVAEDSPVLAAKLRALQERQLAEGTVEGDWLVLGDRSTSMRSSIEVARQVAAALARSVKGQVHLVLFNALPQYYDVTGKTLADITAVTKGMTANGSTSIGVGLSYILERKIAVDGIAIVSDAQENTPPMFAERYLRYVQHTGSEPPVYLYRMATGERGYSDRDLADSMRAIQHELVEFDLRGQVDYYTLPNIVQTMRASRYSLLDEINAAPLLRLDEVLPRTTDLHVVVARASA